MKKKVFLLYVIVIVLASLSFLNDVLAVDSNAIQESEKVKFVSNPKTPSMKMSIVFEEDLTIGEAEGDENYMFGSQVSFITDEEGNFYVADSDNKRIQKYDAHGKYLLSIGREGQGPGEFQSLSAPRFDKNHNLYVNDGLIQRITFFDRNGKHIKQINIPERYFYNPYFNSKGLLLARKWHAYFEGNIQKRVSLYGIFDSEFNLIKELHEDIIEWTLPAVRNTSSIIKFLSQRSSQEAFRPEVTCILADNDFIYLGYPNKYEIKIYSPQGKLERIITRDYDPIPVSEKDKESYVEEAHEKYNSPSYTKDMKNEAFQNIEFRKYKPAYKSFTLMERGWLAVIVNTVDGEYTLFDIFNREGKYIAHFRTSVLEDGGFSGHLFFKNNMAYILSTVDDYIFIKRYNFRILEQEKND